MLGRGELERLSLEKQALLLEGSSKRLVLQAELRELRSATGWLGAAGRISQEAKPLLFMLVPLLSSLLAKISRRPDSWSFRIAGALKWIAPLYQLWKSFASSRKDAEAADPAA